MDPVQEAERIEGSGAPPLTLRLKNSSLHLHHKYHSASEISLAPRQTTNISSSATGSPSLDTQTAFDSPSSVSSSLQGSLHLRSSKNVSLPPSILRAQSMPVYNSSSLMANSPTRRSTSLRGTVPRVRSPRKPIDEVFVGFPNLSNQKIPGNLDLVSGDESPTLDTLCGSNSPANTTNATCFRLRRPESPRLNHPKTPTKSNLSPNNSFTHQPSMYSSRFNDQNYSLNYCYSGSMSYPGSQSHSIPSTPTSTRSRSSSISSLETIPDSPDAEEAALIADQISDHEIDAGILDSFDVSKRRIPRDVNNSRARVIGTGFIREKRKRWSVCGGERRGDLNLDTIWED